MQRSRAELFERGQMFRRAITFVRRQIVLWVNRIPAADHLVAGDLGDDRGRGNRNGKGVTVDDVGLRAVPVDANRVNQEMIGSRHKLLDGPAHGEKRGPINIELIDTSDIDGGNGTSDSVLLDALGQLLASRLIKQFGIAQPFDPVVRFQNYRSGNDRAEQRAAPYFVHARDQPASCSLSELLKSLRALQALEQA